MYESYIENVIFPRIILLSVCFNFSVGRGEAGVEMGTVVLPSRCLGAVCLRMGITGGGVGGTSYYKALSNSSWDKILFSDLFVILSGF